MLAVGTFQFGTCATGAYLINGATGAIITALPVGSTRVFSQPVFAQGTLFVATETNGLYDFAPGP